MFSCGWFIATSQTQKLLKFDQFCSVWFEYWLLKTVYILRVCKMSTRAKWKWEYTVNTQGFVKQTEGAPETDLLPCFSFFFSGESLAVMGDGPLMDASLCNWQGAFTEQMGPGAGRGTDPLLTLSPWQCATAQSRCLWKCAFVCGTSQGSFLSLSGSHWS